MGYFIPSPILHVRENCCQTVSTDKLFNCEVLCSNSLLDSTEYWLRNERALCQVGLVEDKAESSCTAICFVNLDGLEAENDNQELQQKLASVSSDLPDLITSLNVCQLKDNELVLVNGLISPENHPENSDDSQVGILPSDLCLVQCARKCRKNDVGCVIYEINKCLIGLESVQAKRLQPQGSSIRKAEDDTNCSVSSIEEDFITASEHLDEEEYEINISNGKIIFNPHTATELGQCHSLLTHFKRKTSKSHADSTRQSPTRKDLPRTEPVALSSVERGQLASCTAEWAGQSLQRNLQADFMDTKATGDQPNVSSSLEDNEYVEGEYASNLAESVLQDAFIKLSQSEATFTTEAAVSISAGNHAALSACDVKEDPNPPCPWNILPKIVIVQSPDNCENPAEWQEPSSPTVTSCLDSDHLVKDMPCAEEGASSACHDTSERSPTPVEVALACAANVIGTISSPQLTESLQLDQALSDGSENSSYEGNIDEDGTLLNHSECDGVDFCFSSALCGVTQVASAVAVAGLGDGPDLSFSVASSGLLSAADTSAAIPLQCNVSVSTCMDNFAYSIAEVLVKEAANVLLKPDLYKSVGDFLESMDKKLIETVTKPKLSQWEESSRNDFAQNVSNLIVKHSFQEAQKRVGTTCQANETSSGMDLNNIFVDSAQESLFNVIYFTCRKIGDIGRHSDASTVFSEDDGYDWKEFDFSLKQRGRMSEKSSQDHNSEESFENFDPPANFLFAQESQETAKSSKEDRRGSYVSGLSQQIDLNSMWLYREGDGDTLRNDQLRSRKITDFLNLQPHHKEYDRDSRSFSDEKLDIDTGYRDVIPMSNYMCPFTESREAQRVKRSADKEQNCVLVDGQNTISPYKSPLHATQPADTSLSITGFADHVSKTVVSMATEMAAICLENTNAKQPWFCPWKRKFGDPEKFMTAQSTSRASLRSKESQSVAPVSKKLRPPRLSEIKRKTQEQPELKEKLMNRVVDESMNFDDALDPINSFANDVASKIVNSAELAVIDSVRQGQGLARNRLLCDKWSRGKASSYESIPEETTDSSSSLGILGSMARLGQPISRASSISKQSSCESITDEFSNFMVNQMESEGRGFDLLLDYYAGKHASDILSAALQQVCRKNGHLTVNTTCLSKQSSTESITEEFYKYMLKEMDKESKDKTSKEWRNSLLPPAGRPGICLRQSSMPDRRASEGKLTVTPPVKANSFDGFAQSDHRDTLDVCISHTPAPSALYKSLTDSCLYQKCKSDRITEMLINETWSNSIEALMRKNKIICISAESPRDEHLETAAQPHVEQYASRLAANIVNCGKSSLSGQLDPIEPSQQEAGTESRKRELSVSSRTKPEGENKSFPQPTKKEKLSHCPRDVPLIHIESDQKGEIKDCFQEIPAINAKAMTEKRLMERRHSEVDSDGIGGSSLRAFSSTSDESMGSWSQLVNEDDHAEDSSSYLHLSESNGNSSTSSSLGLVELDAYQENGTTSTLPSNFLTVHHLVGAYKHNEPFASAECTSGLTVGPSSYHKDFLVMNFDLNPDYVDFELRATLQWIAACELGLPAIYFKKSQEKRIQKFLDVARFAHQKAWNVGDLFLAVLEYCKLQEEGGRSPPRSLFDWLLEFG
uniref:SPHK1 interactor, AKAP domain containing n=1 Tax=Callorhinchus milii TaxID=7868 RepID=A0A4W3HUK4_CALMI